MYALEISITEGLSTINPLSIHVSQKINILDPPPTIAETSTVNDTFMTKLYSGNNEKFAFTPTNFFVGPATSFVIVGQDSPDGDYKVYDNIYLAKKIVKFNPENSAIKALAVYGHSFAMAVDSNAHIFLIDSTNFVRSAKLIPTIAPEPDAFTDCRFLFRSDEYIIALCQSPSQALLRISVSELTDSGVSSSNIVYEIKCASPIEAKLIQNYLFILDSPVDSDPVFSVISLQLNCKVGNCAHEALRVTPADLGVNALSLTGFDVVNGLDEYVKIFFTDKNLGIVKLFVNVSNPSNLTYSTQIFPLQKALKINDDPQFVAIKLVSTDIVNQHAFFVICRNYHTLLLRISEKTTAGGSPVGLYQIFHKYPYNLNIGSISFDSAFMVLGVYNTLTNCTELVAYSIAASLYALQSNFSESLGRYQLIGSVPIALGEINKANLFAISSSNTYGLTGTFVAVDNHLGAVSRYFLSTNITFECVNPVNDPREIRAIAINDFSTRQVVLALNEQDIGRVDVIFVLICILFFFVVTLIILMGIVFEKSAIIITLLEKIFDKVK